MHRYAFLAFLILVCTFSTLAWAVSSSGSISSCMLINTPGDYHLESDLTGAPIEALSLNWDACIIIASSNVSFDCAGHRMTNDGSVPSAGVVLAGGPFSDVLVKNCKVDDYTNGFYIKEASNSVFLNNSVFSKNVSVDSPNGPYLKMGFFSSMSNSNRYENNSLYNGSRGFDIQTSNDNIFTNNNVVNSGLGLENSMGNDFIENNVIDIGGVIFFRRSNSNNFKNNDIRNSTIHLFISENNTFDGNVIHDGDNFGFSTGNEGNSNVFSNNKIFNKVAGGIILGSDHNQIISNEIFNITGHESTAMEIRSSNNTITGNIIHDFQNIGVALYGSSFNTITDNKFYNGHIGFLVMESGSTNLFSGNIANNVEMDLICQNGKCEERGVQKMPPEGGCTSDSNCTPEQYCNKGSCTPVITGACGNIVKHAWVPYECCADADCPGGQSCQDNKCTGNAAATYDLSGPKAGYMGEIVIFTAHINSIPMGNAQLKVTRPDGSFEMLKTDSIGIASFNLTLEGTYDVYLLIGNEVAITSSVVSSQKETTFPLTGELLVILVMVIGVVAFLVYNFFKGKKVVKKKKITG